jgi:hypothetical protein
MIITLAESKVDNLVGCLADSWVNCLGESKADYLAVLSVAS